MADAECQHLGVLIKRGGGRQRAIKTSECQAVRYDNDGVQESLGVAASAAETDVRRLSWVMWYVALVAV